MGTMKPHFSNMTVGEISDVVVNDVSSFSVLFTSLHVDMCFCGCPVQDVPTWVLVAVPVWFSIMATALSTVVGPRSKPRTSFEIRLTLQKRITAWYLTQ